jgi:hypothetical protein
MKSFTPGLQYNQTYLQYVWVCINPNTRSFEKCHAEHSILVYQRLSVLARGLSKNTFVSTMGCVLGCSPDGATIVISAENKALVFLKDVVEDDLDEVLALYLM